MIRVGLAVAWAGTPASNGSYQMPHMPRLLRRHDFPFVIVADHPGVAGIAARAAPARGGRPRARACPGRTRLRSGYGRSDDRVEAPRSSSRCISAAPLVTRASLTPALRRAVDGGVGVGIELVLVAAHLGEGIGDAIGQRTRRSRPSLARPRRTESRRAPGYIEPPPGGGRRIRPEGARLLHHRHAHAARSPGHRGRVEVNGEYGEQAPPGILRLGVGADQRVVEVEQDGARQSRHRRSVDGPGEGGGAGLTHRARGRSAPRAPPARAPSGRRAGSGRCRRRPTSRWDW